MGNSHLYIQECTDDDCETCEYRSSVNCFFCVAQIGPDVSTIAHVYFRDSYGEVECLGDLCGWCIVQDAGTLIRLLRRRADEFAKASDGELAEYHKLIAQSESLKQHLAYLDKQITLHNRHSISFQRCAQSLNRVAYSQFEYDGIEFIGQRSESETPRVIPMRVRSVKANTRRDGYVYLLRGNEGQYKIGRTRHVPTRFNTLKIQLPFEIELVHYIQVDDAVKCEKSLHLKFLESRLNGEWFSLDSSDVEWFRSLKDFDHDKITAASL